MDFYSRPGPVLRWFNATLSQHMDLYAAPDSGVYVLVEKYHCDIITTSRVYENPSDGRKCLLPPNAWNSPVVSWLVDRRATTYTSNGSNTWAFTTFDEFLNYVKLVHATRTTIPFLKYRKQLQTDHLFRLTDVDSKPPPAVRIKKEKVYIST